MVAKSNLDNRVEDNSMSLKFAPLSKLRILEEISILKSVLSLKFTIFISQIWKSARYISVDQTIY
jgi:hypothetical protein